MLQKYYWCKAPLNRDFFCNLWCYISNLIDWLESIRTVIALMWEWHSGKISTCHLRDPRFEYDISLEEQLHGDREQLLRTVTFIRTTGLTEWTRRRRLTRSSCDREGDSLWQRRFSPGAPVSSYITLQIAIVYILLRIFWDYSLFSTYIPKFFQAWLLKLLCLLWSDLFILLIAFRWLLTNFWLSGVVFCRLLICSDLPGNVVICCCCEDGPYLFS
jgi:hypothetical protein